MASSGILGHMQEDIQCPDFLEEVASLLRLEFHLLSDDELSREATWKVRVRREERK